MRDIKSPRWIIFKAVLFVFTGLAAAALLFNEIPTIKAGLLLALIVWCFCRAYYFAFYVIEHYIDPTYKFSGLWSCLIYLLRRRSSS
jgi:hypothetical protein